MTPKVTLLDHTENPRRVMGIAAGICYTQGKTIQELSDQYTAEHGTHLLRRILASRHLSILEHAYAVFGVEGVSRNFSHQLVRHRNTSYAQQSLHYTLAREDYEVAGPSWEHDMGAITMDWQACVAMAKSVYARAVAAGVPREEARHILPSGGATALVMTANFRQWLHFVEVRACSVNCEEIRAVAIQVKRALETLVPELKQYLGPTCMTAQACYEGDKHCGRPWCPPDCCDRRGYFKESQV